MRRQAGWFPPNQDDLESWLEGHRARVSAHLQAWHVRKDGATVLGLGTWAVDARKTGPGWRIVEETLESPLRVVIPKSE